MASEETKLLHQTHQTFRLAAARVFELRVDVTAYLEGELEDWPPNIQDGIYAAMERLYKATKIKRMYILQSRCGRDVPEEPYHLIVTVIEDKPREVILNDTPN